MHKKRHGNETGETQSKRFVDGYSVCPGQRTGLTYVSTHRFSNDEPNRYTVFGRQIEGQSFIAPVPHGAVMLVAGARSGKQQEFMAYVLSYHDGRLSVVSRQPLGQTSNSAIEMPALGYVKTLPPQKDRLLVTLETSAAQLDQLTVDELHELTLPADVLEAVTEFERPGYIAAHQVIGSAALHATE